MDEYPSIDDSDFQNLLAQRLEFRSLYNNDGLYPHQEFIRRFMSPYTPYKSLIMYHSLGSGKSMACIAVAVDHYLHKRTECIVVTKGDSGTESFNKQIKIYKKMSSNSNNWKLSIFHMKHYISLSNQISNMSDDDVRKDFSNKILILDEVHNVRYLKKKVEKSVYGSIIRLLQTCKNVKVIMSTATPMTDNSEQINSLLGICNYFRENKQSMNGIVSYNPVVCDKPHSETVGTSNYVSGMRVYGSEMIGHQKEVYSIKSTHEPPDDIYRELTHISLFCFEDGTHGREVTTNKMTKTQQKFTITSMSTKQTKEVKYSKYDIMPEFAHMLVGKNLRESSSKYSKTIEAIESSEGNIFIFIEEVKGSGLLLFASMLEQHGYELYIGEDIRNIHKQKRYTMCVGSASICPNNNDRLEGFNSDENKDGEYVRILLGSKVIGESITLKNVRHFHCLTPHWNDSTVDQAIGRVVRNGSHLALDESQREVKIYIHTSIFLDDPESSVDIKKLLKCREKDMSIQKVTDCMIEKAVDKYCLDEHSPVNIKYFTNFSAAYIHSYIDLFRELLGREFDSCNKSISIKKLSKKLDINEVVVKEAVCRIIFFNLSTGPCLFLRAYGNMVFAVEDPSMPYVTLPDVYYTHENQGTIANKIHSGETVSTDVKDNEIHSDKTVSTDVKDIQTFRYIPVVEKASLLEMFLQRREYDILERINTMYANIDGTICHFILYRDLENSYTSTNPVPRKLSCKTRILTEYNTWKNIESIDKERKIISKYRVLWGDAVSTADERWDIYGIISAIDGYMRVRLRSIENKEKSVSDNRYVCRGKNLKSIKKASLLEILQSIQDETVDDSMSISEIVEKIDYLLVESGKYIII